MMRNICICILSIFLLGQLAADINEYHEKVTIKKHSGEDGQRFKLFAEGTEIGSVRRKSTSLTPQYCLLNHLSTQVAKANMRFFGSFVVFDVTDKSGALLGSIHEKLCMFYPKFKIISLEGDNVADAVLNFWRTTWTITDPDNGHTIATLHRPFFRFSNNWDLFLHEVETMNAKPVHPHLFYTLLAIQSDKDYWGDQENFFEVLNTEELNSIGAIFEGVKPSKVDCAYAEQVAVEIEKTVGMEKPDIDKFSEIYQRTLDELFSDEHTDEQKAALIIMLKQVFGF